MGAHWIPLVTAPQGPFMERIAAFRKQHAQELGMVLPAVRFRDGARMGADRYEVLVDGVVAAKGEARVGKLLAIHPAGDTQAIAGEVTRDPTYGLPALWIDEQQRESAVAARFTLVDAPTVFMTHLTEVLRRESATLLTRTETDKLLARVRQAQPSLVEELVPTVLSVSDIQRVLQNLLREKVSIRNLEAILETLADAGRRSKDTIELTEIVRHRLGHAICQGLLGEAGALQVMTLDPSIESQLLQSIQGVREGSERPHANPMLVIEPKMAEQFMGRLVHQAERMMKSNLLPVLLCSPELRRHIRALSERVVPHLRVLSMAEIPQTIELKSWGTVTL
jgi:flagellar biosynthesis protein FlhA